MNADTVDRLVGELKERFEGSKVATEGTVTYVYLPELHFPDGCEPPDTDALVVIDPAQEKPDLLVRRKPRLPNGREPRNVNPVARVGEGWHQYSFNLVWDASRHTAEQFVEGRLRRFALGE